MYKFSSLIFCFFLFYSAFTEETQISVTQTSEMRAMCKEAQDLEKDISKLSAEIEIINQKEKTSAPVIRNIYEILTRCFTVLFDIQRFSNLLVLNQQDNKNDFVRCSIIIKNFASYFRSISSQIGKAGTEISVLRKNKQKYIAERDADVLKYAKLQSDIELNSVEIAKLRKENVIQNDVVYHLATKSESIEELDAELEAENAVGVLKNTKISTDLSIAYPVYGKIVTAFGDKGADNEMICYMSLEASQGAIVTSPAKGVVVFTGKFLNYGNILIISNGEYRIFLYGMSKLFTATGDVVEIGDYVGRMSDKSMENPVIKMQLRKLGEALDPSHWILQTLEKGKEQ